MSNIYDSDLEELELTEVSDEVALEAELNRILEESEEDFDSLKRVEGFEDIDDIERLFNEKNDARKRKSVLLARRRKRQIKNMTIAAAVASVVLVLVTIALIVVLIGNASSSLKMHNTDVVGATTADDVTEPVTNPYEGDATVGLMQTLQNETLQVGIQNPTDVQLQETVTMDQTKTEETTANTVEPSEQAKPTETTKPSEQVKPAETAKPTQSSTTATTEGQTNIEYVTITDSNVTAKYAALYDVSSGQLMAGKSPNTRMYPASMTKVMTLIVACENITNWESVGTLTQAEADYLYKEGASRAGYAAGDSAKAKDLIYGLILKSGCDASIMLAKIVSGSESEFAKLMNIKCKELGLSNTHFTNSSGLHDANQYTTVSDMCKLMDYAMKNSLCAKVLGTAKYTYTYLGETTTWYHKNISTYNSQAYTGTSLSCMNVLNNKGITVHGVKSGFTDDAGNCLVTCVEKNGKRYIAVVGDVVGQGKSTINSTRIFLNYIK